jgi:DNA-binding LytR/AlgR family response regulator
METIKLLRKKQVPPSEVILLRADINYTELHFTNGKTLVLARTLKKLESDFYPFGFFRINKSNIINLKFLSETYDDFAYVILKNKLELNVSRRRREDLKNVINFNLKTLNP